MKLNRIIFYDFVKALLIIFVVLGHTLEMFAHNPIVKSIYLFIYSFHMPLFVFISGFFAKWNKNKFFCYLIMFAIFSAIPNLISTLISKPINIENIARAITAPMYGMWFLLAMPLWSLSLLVIKKVKLWHILMFVLLTLALGYLPFIGEILTLSRLFYFFPFYLIGKWCSQNKEIFTNLIKKLQTIPLKIFCGAILLTTLLLLIFVFDNLPITFFYGRMSYSYPGEIVIRLICLVLGFINGFSVLMLVPFKESSSDFKKFSMASLGQKTLNIYIFHLYIILGINELCKSYLPQTLSNNLLFILPISIILALSIVLLTSLKPFEKITNYFLTLLNTKKTQ